MAAVQFSLICLIWGSTWLAIKIGLEGVPPFLGAGLRFFLAALMFGVFLLVRGKPLRLSRGDRICILSLGILIFWLDYALVYWAETRISSGLTAILFSTMPLMTSLLSAYWTRSEKLGTRKLAGVLVGVAGTALLFWPQERLGVPQVLGMLAALGGSLLSAINLVTMKRHGKNSDNVVLSFFGMSIGSLCLLLMSATLERGHTVAWTRSNVLALVYLTVIGSVVAFTLYYSLIKQIDATIVSLTTLVIPVVALVLGWLILNERVTPLAVAGIATVLGGVALTTKTSAPGPTEIR